MEIKFNVTGTERKALVEAISEFAGWAPVYKKAPTFAYVVQNYTIDKNGTLLFDERTDVGDARSLLAALAGRGFAFDDPFAAAESAADTPAEADFDRLVIEVPLEGFTETALSNLEKLVASKAALIMKSLGTEALPIVREDGRLCFPWFTLGASKEEVRAYTQLIHALCELAKKQRRVTAQAKPAESEKFALRCFLLRLGFIGDEYAAARKILLANLPGDGAFKTGKRVNMAAQAADYPDADTDADAIEASEYAADSAAVAGGASAL